MKKMKQFKAFVILALSLIVTPLYGANPDFVFSATDNDGMKFTIEAFESETNERHVDLIIYKDSEPDNKIYGNGTLLPGGYYYVNTDTPLFNIAFPKGKYEEMQWHKQILYMYIDGGLFIAPKATKDPGWRIAYKFVKR